MTWGLVAVAGGSLVAGYMGSKSADKASQESTYAADQTIAEQRRQFDLTRADTAPYRKAGGNALASLMARLEAGGGGSGALPQFTDRGAPLPQFNVNAPLPQFQGGTALPQYQGGQKFEFDPSQIENNPNYQFVRDQSLDAADRVLASQGKFGSGNRVAEITKLASGLASGEVNNEFGRQFAASNANYGRGTTDFGINRQGALDQYGMSRDAYDISRANVLDKYNMDLTGYNANYRQNQDTYQRNLGEFGMDYQREADLYGRDQNYLNWLSTVAGVGQNANAQSASSGANMANNISAALQNNAANQGNAAQMKYGSWNNAIQGGMSNYLAYNQNENLTKLLLAK